MSYPIDYKASPVPGGVTGIANGVGLVALNDVPEEMTQEERDAVIAAGGDFAKDEGAAERIDDGEQGGEAEKEGVQRLVQRYHTNCGRLFAHGCTCSNAADACSTPRSSNRRPTICRPTGNPSALKPHGTLAAGFQDMLNG